MKVQRLVAMTLMMFVGCVATQPRPPVQAQDPKPPTLTAPAPFLAMPLSKRVALGLLARSPNQCAVSQGWLYDAWENAIHPGETHQSVDFLAPVGTEVLAPADGYCVASYHTYTWEDAYPNGQKGAICYGLGLFVQCYHPEVKAFTSYAHLSWVNEKVLPYIAPTPPSEAGHSWQPREALYKPVDEFIRQAKEVKRGDLIGKVGITGNVLGTCETPSNPPQVQGRVAYDKGPHLHWEVYYRTPDGQKKMPGGRFDPFGLYTTYDQGYCDVFSVHKGLILADPDSPNSPLFAAP